MWKFRVPRYNCVKETFFTCVFEADIHHHFDPFFGLCVTIELRVFVFVFMVSKNILAQSLPITVDLY